MAGKRPAPQWQGILAISLDKGHIPGDRLPVPGLRFLLHGCSRQGLAC